MAADYPSDQIGPGVDDEIIGNSVVARQVGRALEAGSGSVDLTVKFGPFEPGECLKEILLYWDLDTNSVLQSDRLFVDVRAFALEPKSDGSMLPVGRPMVSPTLPALPAALFFARLPMCWVATDSERWVQIGISHFGDPAAQDGSAWAVMEG